MKTFNFITISIIIFIIIGCENKQKPINTGDRILEKTTKIDTLFYDIKLDDTSIYVNGVKYEENEISTYLIGAFYYNYLFWGTSKSIVVLFDFPVNIGEYKLGLVYYPIKEFNKYTANNVAKMKYNKELKELKNIDQIIDAENTYNIKIIEVNKRKFH